MSIEGRKLLVTGGTGALGRAVVLAALDRGAEVAATYLVAEECAAAEKAFGGRAVLVQADLGSEDQTATAVDAAAAALGGLDGIVAIAGGFDMGPLAEVDGSRFDTMMSMNARSLYHTLRAGVPHLKAAGGGSITAIGARPAVAGAAQMAAYAASKAAVMSLVQSLSQELLASHIRVNAVLPSIIDTPANRAAMGPEAADRWVSPASLARTIVDLGRESARDLRGSAVQVYGRV